MPRAFAGRPFQNPNCSCSSVHFSIQFKYTITVQVLHLFSLPICFCLWLSLSLISFSLFPCCVSRQQPRSFAELKFSSVSSPFINRLSLLNFDDQNCKRVPVFHCLNCKYLMDTTDWYLIVTCDQAVYNQVQHNIIFQQKHFPLVPECLTLYFAFFFTCFCHTRSQAYPVASDVPFLCSTAGSASLCHQQTSLAHS